MSIRIIYCFSYRNSIEYDGRKPSFPKESKENQVSVEEIHNELANAVIGCKTEAAKGCPKVRCAKCDMEFPLQHSADVHNAIQERTLADHITSIVNTRNGDLGVVSIKR